MAKKSTPALVDATGCVTAGVVILIGMIGVGQAAGGIGSLVWAVRSIFDEQNWIHAAVATAAAALFGSIGFGLLTALWMERPRARTTVECQEHPHEPWRGRVDWAAGKISASGGARLFAPILAAVALWWNFASLPLLSALPTFFGQVVSKWAWLVLLIPIAGALFIAAFFYQFFRSHKFGHSVLELGQVPGLIGGQLVGVVRIPRRVQAPEGFRVRLLCVEWLQSGHEHHRHDSVVWDDERWVTDFRVEMNETVVPVLFAIPYKLPETSRPDTERDFQWRLEVRARLEGIDFAATFEVPIYKTAESRRDFQLDEKLLAEHAPPLSNELVLRDAGIVRESLEDNGVRLTFNAARNWRTALVVTLFPLVLSGFAFVIISYGDDARDFFNIKAIWEKVFDHFGLVKLANAVFQTIVALASAAMFVLIVVYMFLVSLDLWLYRSVVEATPTGLAVRGGWLGIGRKLFFAAKDIYRFKSEVHMRSSGGGLWQSVVVVPRRGKGRKRTIGKGISSKLAQEAVIDELNTALARPKHGK